jgi:hypothetical protein
MKHPRTLVLLLVSALLSVFAIPAGATGPGVTGPGFERFSYMAKGTGAQVSYVAPGFPEVMPEPGTPFVFELSGFRKPGVLQKQLSSSSHPEIWKMPALLAMAIIQPGAETPTEVWCVPDKAQSTFTITGDLTQATLQFATDCFMFTGEEEPTEETLPLAVTATWVGTGDLVREKSVTKTIVEGMWAIDRIHSAVRPGSAHVSIVRTDVAGPAGVLFEGDVTNPATPGEGPMPEVTLFDRLEGHIAFVTPEE